ncbi:hypothetical protein NEMBOFW57_004394 [Staphylotrichum longicolle]|uniref:Histone chaperone domain-containing protein n=1 Tax=Staphylotrichum longicolle TaxID=669026 RepID=A0AAD4FBM3_9PEZI|nr:hypothetical protein NEMBOFW57_004394 [Staphylotrichum longicolle]
MRLAALLPALLAGTALAGAALAGAHDSAAATRTAAVYIQPVAAPSTAPSLLAELAIPSSSSSSSSTSTSTTTTGESPDDQHDPSTLVLSYSAPDLPDDAKLVRIGLYDPSAQKWLSSTTVASADNFAKGYAPHFEVTVDDGGEGRDVVLGVLCRGVAIDAGQTRDFGPQARVVRTGRGAQPALGKPVVVRREGGKVVEEEQKTFVQKYIANMTTENGTTEPMDVTNPENGAASATDLKGKGKAPAAEQHVEDASMVEDDDDDDDDELDPEEEPEAADEDNMEEIDLDNVIGRRTRGKVIDFAKAAAENPPEDDEDEDDDEDFVEEDKMDED